MKNGAHAHSDTQANKRVKNAIAVSFISGGLLTFFYFASIMHLALSQKAEAAELFPEILISITASFIPIGFAFLSRKSVRAAGICQIIFGGITLFSFISSLMGGNENGAIQLLSAALPAVLYLTPGIVCLTAQRKENRSRQTAYQADKKPETKNAGSAIRTEAIKQSNGGFEAVNGEIVEYIGHAVDIHIPETVDGERITKIGIRAFCNKNIESVTIPATVTEIHGRAFEDNKISKIELPDNLESIETAAFGGNRLMEIRLPQTLKKINHGAFNNNLLTEVRIPDSVTYIGEYAFAGNPMKSASVLSKQILDIGSFNTDVLIAERCKETQAGQDALKDDDFEYRNSVGGCVLVEKYTGHSKNVVIPEKYQGRTVDAIADYAFKDAGIESVEIPNTIKTIGEEAFCNNQLSKVVIPDSVEVIDPHAFRHNRLSWLTLSRNLKRLGSGAFIQNSFTRVMVARSLILRDEYMKYMLMQGFDAGVQIDVMPDSYFD